MVEYFNFVGPRFQFDPRMVAPGERHPFPPQGMYGPGAMAPGPHMDQTRMPQRLPSPQGPQGPQGPGMPPFQSSKF